MKRVLFTLIVVFGLVGTSEAGPFRMFRGSGCVGGACNVRNVQEPAKVEPAKEATVQRPEEKSDLKKKEIKEESGLFRVLKLLFRGK